MHISRRRSRRSFGFTLIELLVAAALAGLLMMTSIPYLRQSRKSPLVRATEDLVEACRQARSKAVLRGVPMQVVIYDNGGAIGVEPAPVGVGAVQTAQEEFQLDPTEERPSAGIFEARLDDDVAFRVLFVNGRDRMMDPFAVIRFFPTGVSDAMEAELQWLREDARRITLDIMTGRPSVEAAR